MNEKIKRLEKQSLQLEPNKEDRLHWQRKVEQYAFKFIDGLSTSKTYIPTEDGGKNLLDYPISDQPLQIEKVLTILEKNVDNIGLNPASGGHLGYIPGGGVFPTALGDYLAAVTNRYAGIYFGGPVAVRIENMLIRWMCSVMGYP